MQLAASSKPPIPVKPQKACVLCRRSKVKCVHDGVPPCKRCIDNKTECKFRLRADDENWRERTDEVINKLESSIEYLLQQQQQKHGENVDQNYSTNDPPINPPSSVRLDHHYAAMDGVDSSRFSTSPIIMAENKPSPYNLDTLIHSSNDSNTSQHGASTPPAAGSMYRHQGGNSSSFHDRPRPALSLLRRPSSTTYLGFDGADGLLSPVGPCPHRSLSSDGAITDVDRSGSLRLSAATVVPPSSTCQVVTAALFRGLEVEQTRPSGIIAFVHEPVNYIDDASRTVAANERHLSIAATSPYANPSHLIGRNDPRLTVISMGLTSMDTARHLFMFFARNLQPHCFGFPSYPPNQHMTPLLISAILMVASMHESSTRHLYDKFRHEAFATLNIHQEVNRNNAFDPELGIGVEEITAACISACWLGGQTAYKIGRIARWWAVGYLKHFEVRSAQTLGEMMSILPPFRQIDLVEKLRIWLMSYVTEAQQAVLHDRPSLIPDCSPAPYCEGLLNASNQVSSANLAQQQQPPLVQPFATAMSSGSASGALASDRQLVAHARMMSIILAGQQIQREARQKIAKAKASASASVQSPRDDAVTYEAMQLVERWREWLEELSLWRLATSQHEDLSQTTETSIDLSLLYHLARTFLASHPLDPELGIIDETHLAFKHTHNLNDSRLAIAQLHTITTAKHSAIFCLQLATRTRLSDKLCFLPNFYHFLLGHAAGVLMTLIQRRFTFLMAKEADSLLQTVDKFVQLYVFQLSCHGFQNASNQTETRTKRSLSVFLQHQSSCPSSSPPRSNRPRHHHHQQQQQQQQGEEEEDIIDPLAPSSSSSSSDPSSLPHLLDSVDRHPSLANAEALARALAHVKTHYST